MPIDDAELLISRLSGPLDPTQRRAGGPEGPRGVARCAIRQTRRRDVC
jgi:hypothetical protein